MRRHLHWLFVLGLAFALEVPLGTWRACAAVGTAPTLLAQRPIGLQPSTSRPPSRTTPVAATGNPTTVLVASRPAYGSFVLDDVTIAGAGPIKRSDLLATWTGLRGQRVTASDIRNIADRVSALCRRDGYAIYQVTVPQQALTGHVRIDVILGRVEAVLIEGNTRNADLGLLRAYAASIVADRPLHQATLERYVLLMNAIPGLTVGSRFRHIPASPDGVQLALTISRKRLEYGIGFDNAGQTALGQTELEANVVVNDLFGEGDRTQLVFGVPIEVKRFQYLALTHVEPLGDNGATLTLSAADLLTHPVGGDISGNATIGGAQFAFPIVERVHENLVGTLGIDALNSNSALVGTSISDERTRAVRVGLKGAADQWLDGLVAGELALSKGLAVLGARRGNIAYGGPRFTKLTLRLSREQHMLAQFVVRAKGFGQYAPERLPGSEQFAFGGVDFGQAFQAVTLTGDRALAGAIELAHPLPAFTTTRWTSGAEAFGFIDAAEVSNARTPFAPDTDRGASAGFGLRTKVAGKVTVQAEAADALVRPTSIVSDHGWRAVVGLTGTF